MGHDYICGGDHHVAGKADRAGYRVDLLAGHAALVADHQGRGPVTGDNGAADAIGLAGAEGSVEAGAAEGGAG